VPKAHLTDIVVQRLKLPGTYFDATTPAFGIRVGKHRKAWIVMRGRERVRTRIGHYPSLSLAEARKQAHKLLGEEPEKKSSLTFEQARAKYFEVHTPKLKPRTRHEAERLLNRHFHWRKKLADITADDIASAVEAIRAPSEAWHAFKEVRTFFRWCVPRYIKHAPTEGLKSPSKYIPRKRVLTPIELKSVWVAAGRAGHPFGTIIRLLILTGQRYGEIVSLRREYINTSERTITLPETKNGRQHTFPFGQMAADILETVPRLNTTALLFPGRDPQEPWKGSGKAKFYLERHPPIRPWTLHDLRRSASTTWASLKVPPHIVERLLNHQLGTLQSGGIITAVAEIYNCHLYLDEMRDAVAKYEAYLSGLLPLP
jgi:integrase